MIARRSAVGAVGVPAVLAGAVVLLAVAGCGGDETPVPAALPGTVTTAPSPAASTVAPVPAVGAPIVPTEASTTASSTSPTSRSSRPSRRTTTRPTTSPTRRTVTVPDDGFGRALYRCLATGRSYDECVD